MLASVVTWFNRFNLICPPPVFAGVVRGLKVIRLLNMDCMEYMATVPDDYFDLAVVDPPYGIDITSKRMGSRRSFQANHNDTWDKATPPQAYFDELFRVSKNQVIFGGNYFSLPPSRAFIIWDKGAGMRGRSFAECEYAWSSLDDGGRIVYVDPIQLDRIHVCQKPIKLYDYIFNRYCSKDFKVLDTHLGSASSAIAAHKFGLAEFVGLEIDSAYFLGAQKRFDTQTRQMVFL